MPRTRSIPSAHYDLGVALKQQDKLDEAKVEFKKAMELDPALGGSALHAGDHLLAVGRIRGERGGDAGGHPGAAGLWRGLLHARHGAEAEGRSGRGRRPRCEEAIRLKPNDPGPYNTLGQVLRQKGDIAGSKAAFAQGAAAKKKLDDSQVELLNKK